MSTHVRSSIYHTHHFVVFSGAHVGFTVKRPKDNTDPRIFQTVVYNSEPGFNTATGKFVCHHPGIYLFTTTVTRNPGIGEARCSISVNGANKIQAIANNLHGITPAYPSASVTLIVHLKTGDEVYLAACSAHYISSESSFSGVLIRPDLG